jgi:penicillin V acylase-like amidase (Ntn superfamily)
MKRIIIFFILFGMYTGNACTTFFINYNGQMVFGRNYDWIADAGMICTNQKGLAKTSMKNNDGTTISWISQFGSITFNQYGKEFPTGGMNEKGLVVELMWLDGTIFPSRDDRPAIGVLQWIQYLLDNCSRIDDVIETDKKLRIISKGTPLHYLVADANGNAATIEFLNGKMTVHRNNNLPFPVLTNDTYERSVAAKQNGSYTGSNSLERFAQACTMVQQYPTIAAVKSLIDHSFDILNKVSQGDFTKWSIVYDISNKKIYFKTQRFQQLKSIDFSSVDFSCTSKSKTMDMNKEISGDIKNDFVDFSIDLNRQITEQAFEQSKEQISPASEEKEAVINYILKIFCH